MVLRQVEDGLKLRLKDEGYFRNPQVTVAVETYKSQKVFIVGEVRLPGSYPLSGNMNLVEALARALPRELWRSAVLAGRIERVARRRYFLRVPSMQSPRHAAAWTCGLSPGQYDVTVRM